MTTSNKVLVVGATGYLGLHIVKQLQERGQNFVALARNKQKLLASGVHDSQIFEAQVTDPQQLEGICDGVDVVISCLGITRQQDGLKYMDIDYQANLNILLEAEKSGVEKFIYISAFNAPTYSNVRLLRAKERFASRLLDSEQLQPCVIRPNGFFSDLEAIYHMATKGRVYQFGASAMKLNPIHGEDLATFCLEAIPSNQKELDVGGPEILTTTEIAQLAFEAQCKNGRIVRLPDCLRRVILRLMNHLPEKWGGPAEFFLTVMGKDSIAPVYGEHKIRDHYAALFTAVNEP
ncbi:SDR family oxidoreductase [Vibrio coralliilyticus]|uniref:SDR family oxidoreductase n=1 Tax=Vibrio coralliilyticus TaxID=190893 RepID=A0AAP6ZQB7_9VIBR|nr:SDR family oxidoreductase [Vibrio coralliilyticus]NOJ26179.1 SDR family oxidoreductase [Vibrio coralliilyticus]